MSLRLNHYLRSNLTIDDQTLLKIAACFKRKEVQRNEIVVSQGEICKAFYFIESGILRTYYLTENGQEKTRFIAFDGAIVSAFSSFISQQPSFEFVDALENAVLFEISHSDFYGLMAELPQLEKFYITLLETAYLFQNKKIEQLVTLSAKERYELLLSEQPHFSQRVSNKNLASYLDISQETLSRLKSK